MSLLIENSSVLMKSGRHTSATEVLYAACWLVGEFCSLLANPRQALVSMLTGLNPALAPHIQATFVHNILKLYSRLEEVDTEIDAMILGKLEELVSSPNLEVQERACTALQLVRSIANPDLGEEQLRKDLQILYAGEIKPCWSKAQKKVPVPEGLDLDAWINEPEPEESDEEDEVEENLAQVFFKDDRQQERGGKKSPSEPTEEELVNMRAQRLANQSSNPNYLKSYTPTSPSRQNMNGGEVDEIGIQSLDLDVPLYIPGLKSADSYFNIESSSTERKHKKKKKKKSKKVESSSEDDDGPNVAVSRNLDMPEGASLSDQEEESLDPLDPHSALAAISLEDLQTPPKGEKKKKKKSESGNQGLVNIGDIDSVDYIPEGVEAGEDSPIALHVSHKKKKKSEKKSKKSKKEKHAPKEDDLLGLDDPVQEQSADPKLTTSSVQVIGSDAILQVSLVPASVQITDSGFTVQITVDNTSQQKVKDINLLVGEEEFGLTASLKPGSNKTKTVIIGMTNLQPGTPIQANLNYKENEERSIELCLVLPATAWLQDSSIEDEIFAELLVSGKLEFMLSKQIQTSLNIQDATSVLSRQKIHVVQVQGGSTVSLHALTTSGHHLAFLLKPINGGSNFTMSLEGRSSSRELLAAVLDLAATELAAVLGS